MVLQASFYLQFVFRMYAPNHMMQAYPCAAIYLVCRTLPWELTGKETELFYSSLFQGGDIWVHQTRYGTQQVPIFRGRVGLTSASHKIQFLNYS